MSRHFVRFLSPLGLELVRFFVSPVFGKLTEEFSTIVENFKHIYLMKKSKKSSCIFKKNVLNLNQRIKK